MAGKIRVGLSNPGLIYPYVERWTKLVRTLVKSSGYLAGLYYIIDAVFGTDRFRSYLEQKDTARYIEVPVDDFRMRIDLLDVGLSQSLLVDGTREPLATARYRAELRELERRRGGLTVVDIGANLGYFAFQYLSRSRPAGRVLAFEPVPSTFDLLQQNVRLNGFEGVMDCYQLGLGAMSKEAKMQLSNHRNLATVQNTAPRSHYVAEIRVSIRRLDEVLPEIGVPLESVDVLRMDLQGYEYEVFQGMSRLLEEGSIGLVFVEIHPWAMDDAGKYDHFLEMLQEAGFELVFAADGRTAFLRKNKQTYAERELPIDSIEGLRDIDFTVEVILRG